MQLTFVEQIEGKPYANGLLGRSERKMYVFNGIDEIRVFYNVGDTFEAKVESFLRDEEKVKRIDRPTPTMPTPTMMR
jgi:hypothetical protein